MYFCRSKNHVWLKKEDADKCCNGYKRIMVIGKNIPANAKKIQIDKASGLKYTRVWVKNDSASVENHQELY